MVVLLKLPLWAFSLNSGDFVEG